MTLEKEALATIMFSPVRGGTRALQVLSSPLLVALEKEHVQHTVIGHGAQV